MWLFCCELPCKVKNQNNLKMELGPPDVMERKGALTLRSNSAYYGRPTLVSQNRETEPKDYDIHDIPLGSKNLCQSTYWRFGTMDQLSLFFFPLRDTGLPETGFGAVLPRHPPEKFKMFMDTSYRSDYVPPYDYIPYVTPDTSGYSVVHRKCHSQFTDTADYRRHGINTWQDESGVYANTDLKQKVFPVTNPIPTYVEEANS
uniref:Cilia and flagella associated protein 95 n=1 Tax=Pseudonaja textilis TaxID=8673 RepID=A0A670ZYU0_PSETE